ncbi:MAG: type III polyketide synthase [Nanoarchaeota archaeon]|nr:type III polyketide synthase [Nanoarchaeota archaeon]
MSNKAYINSISTAVPPYKCHHEFLAMLPNLASSHQDKTKLRRMARNSQIDTRYSVLVDVQKEEQGKETFYRSGHYPSTAERMKVYEREAIELSVKAAEPLVQNPEQITHLIVTSCTGFYAPGLDVDIVQRLGLSPNVERNLIGFMGCYAAFNGLKLANHIVGAKPDSQVLMVNTELCTLHLQENVPFDQLVSFLLFADGAAASIVSSKPQGLAIEQTYNALLSDSYRDMSWRIGNQGFKMTLATTVPATIRKALGEEISHVVGEKDRIRFWAIHGGGRKILDEIQEELGLSDDDMHNSRDVLRRYGNMSSPTVMFALKAILEDRNIKGLGCAMAFGPGLTLESMILEKQ